VINLGLMLLFCLAIAIFAAQNTLSIPLKFLGWTSPNFSVAILVILSASIGVLLTFFLSIPTHHRRRKLLKEKDRELADLKDALNKH
jgi:uncharacterized integral membrane protein